MDATAAALVDRTLPRAPYRQWVLTVPWRIRLRLAADKQLLSRALSALLRTYAFVEVKNWSAELRARHEIFLSLIKLAAELGVEFAFPTRTLHVDSLVGKPPRQVGGKAPPSRQELGAIVERYGPATQ